MRPRSRTTGFVLLLAAGCAASAGCQVPYHQMPAGFSGSYYRYAAEHSGTWVEPPMPAPVEPGVFAPVTQSLGTGPPVRR